MELLTNVCDAIARNDFCSGCGVCAGICPENAIIMKWNGYGEYNPSINQSKCTNCRVCLKVCPFWNQDINETKIARIFLDTEQMRQNSISGFYEDIYSGYCCEGSFRKDGAGGGLTSWLLSKMLLEKKVTDVCCVRQGTSSEKLFEVVCLKDSRSVAECSKSVYYPIEFSSIIARILSVEGRYALVGLPCVLKAIRLAMQHNQKLRERIVFLIGLFCGQQKSRFFAEYLVAKKGVDPDKIIKARFRGKDKNRHHLDHFFEFVAEEGESEVNGKIYQSDGMSGIWGQDWFKLNACNYCDDLTSEVADVSLGDAIANAYSFGNEGANFVVVRNHKINELLANGVDDGEIVLNKVPLEALIERMQGVVLNKYDDLSYRLFQTEINSERAYLPIKRVRARDRADKKANREMETRKAIMMESRKLFAKYKGDSGMVKKVDNSIAGILAKADGESVIKKIIRKLKG